MSTCDGTTQAGGPCGHVPKTGARYCWQHADQADEPEPAPTSITKLRTQATRKVRKGDVISREEGLRELSRIVRRQVKETKTTSTGETYEVDPSNDDVVKAFKEIARASGWYDQGDESDSGPRTVIVRRGGAVDAG